MLAVKIKLTPNQQKIVNYLSHGYFGRFYSKQSNYGPYIYAEVRNPDVLLSPGVCSQVIVKMPSVRALQRMSLIVVREQNEFSVGFFELTEEAKQLDL